MNTKFLGEDLTCSKCGTAYAKNTILELPYLSSTNNADPIVCPKCVETFVNANFGVLQPTPKT
jgi:DNA-directed RNA polymerase subunit RPC12/RpoP